MDRAVCTIDEAFRAAVQRHREGNLQQAAVIYEAILREEPGHAGAWHLLGVTWQQRGDFQRAAEHIAQAIALDGSKAIFHNNLGVALRALGRLEEAEAACRRALAIHPLYADALSNLGIALHEQGRYKEAMGSLEQVIGLAPSHPDALYNLANLCLDLGHTGRAIGLYRETIRVRPNYAGAHNNLGNALLAERRRPEAIAAYRRAIALDPDLAEAMVNLGVARSEEDRIEEAGRYYEQAGRLRPGKPLWKMRSLGLCSAVFSSSEELDRYRQDLEQLLDAWRAVPLALDWRDLAANGPAPSMHLAHHGRDNRRLKEKFAALFAPYFPDRRPPLGRGKPRIGFLVTPRHEGGFLRGTSGIIRHLGRRRFEVVVLCGEGVLERCRREIGRDDVEYVGLPARFSFALERVAAARCDVLDHWQAGSDPLNYFLPFARLAPVQCTGWGQQGTTGIAAVDYFLSSELTEIPEAQEHYTERLYRLRTMPSWQPRVPVPPPAARGDFGLPEQGSLYFCLQQLPKFHPDFDSLLEQILAGDPRGYLVVLDGRSRHAGEVLQERWGRTLGAAAGRVLFLPPQPPRDYYRLLSLADALLDPPHFSSALTGYDAFSPGLPIVTLPGRFLVERYALGLYRKMGIEDLVAKSPEDYVAQAVRLGTDRDYREAVRQRIAQRSEVLFEDREVVRQHEEFFEHALAEERHRRRQTLAEQATDAANSAEKGPVQRAPVCRTEASAYPPRPRERSRVGPLYEGRAAEQPLLRRLALDVSDLSKARGMRKTRDYRKHLTDTQCGARAGMRSDGRGRWATEAGGLPLRPRVSPPRIGNRHHVQTMASCRNRYTPCMQRPPRGRPGRRSGTQPVHRARR